MWAMTDGFGRDSALGSILSALKKPHEALQSLERALELKASSNVYFNLGSAYRGMNQNVKAVGAFRKYIELVEGEGREMDPYSASIVHQHYGSALRQVGDLPQAIRELELAVQYAPREGLMWNELGCCYMLAEKHEKAIEPLKRAAELLPGNPDPLTNLANTYMDMRRYREAVVQFERAIKVDQNWNAGKMANILYAKQCLADWDDMERRFGELRARTHEMVDGGFVAHPPEAGHQLEGRVVGPMTALMLPFNISEQLDIATYYAASIRNERADLLANFRPDYRPPLAARSGRVPRLRVGYISANFGYHVASLTIQGVFGAHNRDRVEVVAIALNPTDPSKLRKRIERESDRFVDLSGLSSVAMIERLYELDLHVLIDMDGYTTGTRRELLMAEAAPVQLLLMGYCSTLGDESVQFLAADRYTIPAHLAPFYSEKILYLPNSYFVNDYANNDAQVLVDTRDGPPAHLSRADYGLPEDGIVYCNFNRHRKFDPITFGVWMRILRAVPNSVLWLLEYDDGMDKMRRYAREHGVNPNRLVFHERFPFEEHLQIKSLADLFLDSPVYNAHTTATDSLWSGVPILALLLDRMASRVAASTAAAADTPDLIAESYEEYFDLAVQYAADEDFRESAKFRVRQSRVEGPLFDLGQWTSDFEDLLLAAYESEAASGKPMHIIT